jgi:hypothetical protein
MTDFVKSYDESKKKAEARGEKIVPMKREIVALIAYMQRLGTDIKVKDTKNKSHVRTNKTQYETIEGVAIYPIVSYYFFLLFRRSWFDMFSYKETITELSQIPLRDN